MSDVPVACYLSAGFDSSTVSRAAAASRICPRRAARLHRGISRRVPGTTVPVKIAAIVAATYRRSHPELTFEITADLISSRSIWITWFRSLDEPRMGHGAFSQFMVARAASAERKVILTGHGGDELFSGYPVFKLALARAAFWKLDPVFIGTVRSIPSSELPHLAYFSMKACAGASGSCSCGSVRRRKCANPFCSLVSRKHWMRHATIPF